MHTVECEAEAGVTASEDTAIRRLVLADEVARRLLQVVLRVLVLRLHALEVLAALAREGQVVLVVQPHHRVVLTSLVQLLNKQYMFNFLYFFI